MEPLKFAGESQASRRGGGASAGHRNPGFAWKFALPAGNTTGGPRTILSLASSLRRAAAALVALALAACGVAPDPGPEASARDFLDHLAAGRIEEAWGMTAFLFQANSTEAVFERAARDYRIRGAADFELDAASQGPQRARFTGTYKTSDTVRVPFEIEMAKERDRWKVLRFAVRLGPNAQKIEAFSALADLQGLRPPDDQPVPNEAELRELARRAMLDFAEAVVAEDFTVFHEKASEIWRAQTSPERLRDMFEPFIQNRMDFRDALRSPPDLTAPPDLDRKGILFLKGAFPDGRYTVVFELRFRYELPRWRLFGLGITVDSSDSDAAAAETPAPAR